MNQTDRRNKYKWKERGKECQKKNKKEADINITRRICLGRESRNNIVIKREKDTEIE